MQRGPSAESREFASRFARHLDEKQATDVVILDVSGPLVIADYFVIGTARNPRHAQAIARELDFTMKHEGRLRRNLAGMEGESSWVLLDFDDVVVHLFLAETRSFYALESLWADVPRVPFEPAADPGAEPPLDAGGESPYRYSPSDRREPPAADSGPPRSKDQ